MKKNADEVGVVSTFGMHSLRKTFGYFYIKNGGNVITLMKCTIMMNQQQPLDMSVGKTMMQKKKEAGYTLLLQNRSEVEQCQEIN